MEGFGFPARCSDIGMLNGSESLYDRVLKLWSLGTRERLDHGFAIGWRNGKYNSSVR